MCAVTFDARQSRFLHNFQRENDKNEINDLHAQREDDGL